LPDIKKLKMYLNSVKEMLLGLPTSVRVIKINMIFYTL